MTNVVALVGQLARPAELRELPSGDRLASLQVTIPGDGRRAETVPVAWLPAPKRAGDFDVGDEVVVVGRVRRRFFRRGAATESRTEVLADTVVHGRQAKQARAALERARDKLEAAAP